MTVPLIRPACRDDAQFIHESIRGLAIDTGLEPLFTATVQQLTAALFDGVPEAEAIVAEWQGQPAAYAIFNQKFSTFKAQPLMWLEDIHVNREFRRFGIGRAMLAHLAMIVRQRGWLLMEWAVVEGNDVALEFYRDLDARLVDDWINHRLEGGALDALAREGGWQ